MEKVIKVFNPKTPSVECLDTANNMVLFSWKAV